MSDIPEYKTPQTWRFELDVVERRLTLDVDANSWDAAQDKLFATLKGLDPSVLRKESIVCPQPEIRLRHATKLHPPGWKPRRDHSGKEGSEA